MFFAGSGVIATEAPHKHIIHMGEEPKDKRAFNPAPKTMWEKKWRCHQLMEEIWGTNYAARCRAYAWLEKRFGKPIHFSQVNDPALLEEIFQVLFAESFRVARKRQREENMLYSWV